MPKCSICNSRKGKRKCKVDDTFICTLCCGQSRSPDKCVGCSFIKNSLTSRNYRKVPFCETQQMSNSFELQDISNVIESIFCGFDLDNENEFKDSTALKLIELFLDRHYFKDRELSANNSALMEKFKQMSQIIEQDLPDTPDEQLIKVYATIYRSIQRRTNGGNEYLKFAQQYIGARVGPGVRLISNDSL